MEQENEEDLVIVIMDPDSKKYKNLSAPAKLIYRLLVFEYIGMKLPKGVYDEVDAPDLSGVIEDVRRVVCSRFGYRATTLGKAVKELRNKRVIKHLYTEEVKRTYPLAVNKGVYDNAGDNEEVPQKQGERKENTDNR